MGVEVWQRIGQRWLMPEFLIKGYNIITVCNGFQLIYVVARAQRGSGGGGGEI